MSAGTPGMPELLIILAIAAMWVVPIAAAVWALVTLHRIRVGQESIRLRLEAIERSIQRTPDN